MSQKTYLISALWDMSALRNLEEGAAMRLNLWSLGFRKRQT